MTRSHRLAEPTESPRGIRIAMILLALMLVYLGLAQPGQRLDPVPPPRPAELALYRADANAGFPLPAHPDDPPRGPGE